MAVFRWSRGGVMALRRGQVAPAKKARIAGKRCPTCHMGTLDQLKDGQRALQDVIAQQRLKALAKARRVKARNAKRRRA